MTTLGLGAHPVGDGRCCFRVWAPAAGRLALLLEAPSAREVALEPEGDGYHGAVVEGVEPGARYRLRVDGGEPRPDPASRCQPEGVHGPSQVVDPGHPWQDAAWIGVRLEDLVLYELHVGTYTSEGTFAALIPHLDRLRSLGVTAIQLMPVMPFPGSRNWGYDGVAPFAVHTAYGGPEGLKVLVDACHRRGLGVLLDVVYNHLGPEGNYLSEFGPFFTDRHHTPWGAAVNYDGPDSDGVRRFFLEAAVHWITEFHVDGLRLDAVHAIIDHSPRPFLAELAAAVHAAGRARGAPALLIPESNTNDPRLLRPPELGGIGLDAQLDDDFHHALHALLTGERHGYYADYGSVEHLARVFRRGFSYTGQYSAYRRRRHGAPTNGLDGTRFVAFAQDHDQVGNRAGGDRLTAQVDFEALKLAAGVVILSPFVPFLFMGEEHGEPAPFQYFVSHGDADLVEAVRRGRREEFADFAWGGALPDPQDEAAFARSKIDHERAATGRHQTLRDLYAALLRLRRELPALASRDLADVTATAFENPPVLLVERRCTAHHAAVVAHFGHRPARLALPLAPGSWQPLLDTADPRWGGAADVRPQRLESLGILSLDLPPSCLLLLDREIM